MFHLQMQDDRFDKKGEVVVMPPDDSVGGARHMVARSVALLEDRPVFKAEVARYPFVQVIKDDASAWLQRLSAKRTSWFRWYA